MLRSAAGLAWRSSSHSRAISSRSLEVVLQEDRVGQAVLGDLAVEAAALHQLLVGAAVDDPRRGRGR